MPSYVVSNGAVTRRPGVRSTIRFAENAGATPRVKRLAVVGNFPMLQQGVAQLVRNKQDMLRFGPKDKTISRLAKACYKPGRDKRIGNGPSEIWLCSAATSTQAQISVKGFGVHSCKIAALSDDVELPKATINVDDTSTFGSSGVIVVPTTKGYQLVTYSGTTSTTFTGCTGGVGVMAENGVIRDVGGNTAVIKSKLWGKAGNRVHVEGQIGTDGAYKWIIQGDDKPEVFSDLRASPLFSLKYDGGDFTTVVGGFNSSKEFFATATKTAQAIGTFTCDCVWNGIVTVDPSIAPTTGSYTATVNGLDENGASTNEVLTWLDGGGHAPKSTTKEFSHITSVVLANVGGGGSPTFIISGDMIRVVSDDYPFVGDLLDFIEDFGANDFELTGVSDLAAGVELDELDAVASTSLASAVTFGNTMSRLSEVLNQSATIEFESNGSGSAPIPFSAYLSEGTLATQSAPTDADWPTAFEGLKDLEPNPPTVIALLSGSDSAHGDLAAHCNDMWGVDAYEVQGWTGSDNGITLEQVRAKISALNDYRVSFVPQEAKHRRLDGKVEWIEPYWYALYHAAAQCSVGMCVPLTWKCFDVLEVRFSSATIKIPRDREALLATAATFTTKGPNGLRVERSLTTHLSDNDPARTAPSCVESLANILRRVRFRVQKMIGDPASDPTEARVKSLTESELDQIVIDKEAKGFVRDSVDAQQAGDTFDVGFDVEPIYEITHANLNMGVVPVSLST